MKSKFINDEMLLKDIKDVQKFLTNMNNTYSEYKTVEYFNYKFINIGIREIKRELYWVIKKIRLFDETYRIDYKKILIDGIIDGICNASKNFDYFIDWNDSTSNHQKWLGIIRRDIIKDEYELLFMLRQLQIKAFNLKGELI